jgi:glutaredoxin
VVTVVRSSGCHYCEDAAAALAEIGARHPLRVEYLDTASAEGADLVAGHRAPMFPLVLVDGQFFSSGRLPRHKLISLLQARSTACVR